MSAEWLELHDEDIRRLNIEQPGTQDKCRPVEVDGEIIRVLGGREMNAADREAFADIVRAAKHRFAADVAPCPGSYGYVRCQGCDDPHCMEGKP